MSLIQRGEKKKNFGSEKEKADVLKPPCRCKDKCRKSQWKAKKAVRCGWGVITLRLCVRVFVFLHIEGPSGTGFVHSTVVSSTLETFAESYQFPLTVIGPNATRVNTTPMCQETRKRAKRPNSHTSSWLFGPSAFVTSLCLSHTDAQRTDKDTHHSVAYWSVRRCCSPRGIRW